MNVSPKYPTVKLLGVDICALRMDEVLDIVNDHIANRQRILIGVVNVAKIVNARKNSELRAALDNADLVLADGAPIVWLSRMLGEPLPERVTGIDIMFKLLREANDKHYSIYFLGAKSKVLQDVIKVAQKDYPCIHVAGYRDGYFNEDQEQSVAENIRHSQADILFVAISPPKKEIFLRKWQAFMDVPICHGVGGSFDIVAGVTKRAPLWMRKCSLEWLYRLIQEPRRMWRRYLVTNAIFIKLSFAAILRARSRKLFHKSTYMTTSNAKNK